MSLLKRRPASLRLVGAAVLAASLVALSAAPAAAEPTPTPSSDRGPAAQAPAAVPGDNGDVKIHNLTTPADDQRDEPKVCGFYLVGFNFDAGQQVRYAIVKAPPFKGAPAITGTLVLDANGFGRTADLSLPDGHYKLFWTFVGELGRAKQKVFKVECKRPSPSPTPDESISPSPSLSESASPTPSVETTTPGVSTSPSPDQPGALPITGVALTGVLGAGLALLIAGIVTLFIVRRRSTQMDQLES